MNPAQTVLSAEIAALKAVAEHSLGPSFDQACNLIIGLRGKLVVTGMGKAGLIGQKISATLRSTGQPSVFLDPAQALHGDMGMLGAEDGVLAISNSGKTDEVIAVCSHAKAIGLPVIALTSGAESPLRHSRVLLTYPVMPEGCPIDCAPMASTMMMLAIGDAIAATLIGRRGFTSADFYSLHHGGYLGKVLSTGRKEL